MKRLSLNVQTLYADLAQSVTFSDTVAGSVFAQKIKGKTYLYATEKHGATRLQHYLGPAEDPDVLRRAEDIRRAAQDARLRRTTVSMLKRSGVPAPTLVMGRLMEAVANAGLFRKGLVLVGTGAYQVYSPLVGTALAATSLTTHDADLAAASLAIESDVSGESLLDVLLRADPTFTPQPGLDDRVPPKRFRSQAGLEVDVLTCYRSRKDDEKPVVLPGLECSAQPLRFLEYLIDEPIDAVALYGPGVRVRVPQPARYAVHKLIVAQVRAKASTKWGKDLAQAAELLEALELYDPGAIEDALDDARSRGARWRKHIDASFAAIERG
jgi:hypothetical protein